MYNSGQSKRFIIAIFVLLLGFFVLGDNSKVYADNSYITIVNPVRISSYTKDPNLSLKTEYEEIQKREFPATWLLTYDVLSHADMVRTFLSMDKKQDLGIFLEVTEPFSKNANVSYNQTNSWHRATSLFLSGYTDTDRKKLIDAVFSKFKKTFGYYPKSVGAWWVDSFSLSYMREKYHVDGVLGVSDQYDLDGYQIWGTPLSPYYPNKVNAAIPANSINNKLDIVTFRWAARDPLNGYISPSSKQASLYSTQDYATVGLSPDYFKKLIDVYTNSKQNEYGQITVGLESDYSPDVYTGIYSNWLDYVKETQNTGSVVSSMDQFSTWYREKFPILSPNRIIQTDDLLGSLRSVFWFNSNSYRLGLVVDKKNNQISVLDFRVYPNNLMEPFYKEPNGQYNLSINLPYILDQVIDKNSLWKFNLGNMVSITRNGDNILMKFQKGNIMLMSNMIRLPFVSLPNFIKNSNQIDFRTENGNVYIYPKKNYPVSTGGLLIHDFTLRIPFTIQYRLEGLKILIALILFVVILLLYKFFKERKKVLLLSSIFVLICLAVYFLVQLQAQYFISQTEYDGLSVLSKFPKGKVLIYDKNCLKCTFETPYKPAGASGRKGYIGKYSGQLTTYNISFFTAKNSSEGAKILKNQNIRYLYLVKYEKYIESLPFSPTDTGLKKIYENANVEIFEVLP